MNFFTKKQLVRVARFLCFIFLFQICIINNTSTASAATNTKITYSIKGTPKAGNTIEILVNVSDAQSLYGSSIDFVYDSSLLEIQSIDKGSIYGSSSVAMPIKSFGGGKASFAIMLKGSHTGVNGAGSIAIIKAKILKSGSFKFKTTPENSNLSLTGNTFRVKLANNNSGKISYTASESTLTVKNITPLPVGTYEENNPNIYYSGSWIAEKHELYSSGAGIYSKTSGDIMEFIIDGTSFEIYAPVNADRGKANIYIDNKLECVMDQYSPTLIKNKLVLSKYGLSPGKHTVRIETISEKNSKAKLPYTVIDKIIISNNSLPTGILTPGTYDENNPNIAFKGSWILEKHELYTDNAGRYSKTIGNTIQFTIDATSFELYIPATTDRGKANIYIDGKLDSVMDQFSSTLEKNQLVFSRYGLSPGKHTIKIETTNEKNSGSTNPFIVFDKLVVSNSLKPTGVLKPGTYEESNPNILLNGSWNLGKHKLYSEGSAKYSKTPGNTIEFTIDATSFELYAPTLADRGKANVYIDGIFDSVMDQYSPSLVENNLVYAKYGLAPGKHTIKIETISESNPNSTNPYIVIDKLLVSNAKVLPAGVYEENNSYISKTGSWITETHDLYSNGKGIYSKTSGNTIEFTIYGSSLELYSPVAEFRGKANVFIDGKLVSIMDQYSPKLKEDKLVFAKYNLPLAKHTVKIETIADKHPNATLPYIVLDKIVVGNTSKPSNILTIGNYEENNVNITFKGSWINEKHSLYSNSNGKYSKTAGNTVEFTFEGTGFELFVPSGEFRGKANIYIDGNSTSIMDQYTSKIIGNKLVFSKYDLPYGTHKVKIETTAQQHPNSTEPFIVFDKLVIK